MNGSEAWESNQCSLSCLEGRGSACLVSDRRRFEHPRGTNEEETGIAQRACRMRNKLVGCDKELRRGGIARGGSNTSGVAPKRLIALGTPISGAVGPYGQKMVPYGPRPMSGRSAGRC